MTGQDRDRAVVIADQLVRRPLTRRQQRQADRLATAAAVLARQLEQRAASSRRRGR
jgi:hypothetical protein